MTTPEPAIVEHHHVLNTNGRAMPVFIAAPNDEVEHPAIIIVHEIFGLNDHIREIARRFARSGIVAYAPCLFAHHPDLPDDQNNLERMREVWKSIPDERLIGDLQATFSYARSSERVRSNAIGTIGYCMGGAIAYMFACRTPLVSFVLDYYGRIYYPSIESNKPRHPIDYSGGLNCPFMGFFAGIDELIPQAHIEALEKKLAELGKSFKITVYPKVHHAFFNDTRPNYDAEAASESWQLTLNFIAASTRV